MFKTNEKKKTKLVLKTATILHLTSAQLAQIISGSDETVSRLGTECPPK